MAKKRSKRKRHIFRNLFFAVTLMGLAFLLLGAAYIFELDAWRDFDPELILGADQTLILYDIENNEICRLHGTQDRVLVSLSEIPDIVQKAFLAAEDARFYDHIGIDFIRIIGAAWADLKAGSYVQGASTISQQLIKQSHLNSRKTMERKLEEAVLAYQLEQAFTKDQILEMYLNYVYFGGGYYGIEAASLGYFGVHAKDLNLPQAAQLAGILKGTAVYAPHLDYEASINRRNLILNLMCDYGFITAEQRDEAKTYKPVIVHGTQPTKRGYYVDHVLIEACKLLDITMDELLTGGYRIYTAMDSALQSYAEELFANEEYFPSADTEAVIVVIRVTDGTVAALVGGKQSDVALGFNRAVSLRRQPGSVIKPILVYAPALENFGYTTATMLLDTPTEFGDYKPKNSGDSYYGWVTLRQAVTKSLNVPAVRVLSSIGVDTGKMFAERLGIEFDSQDNSLTLALGGFTYGVSPYQIAGAYACFGNGGIYNKPSVIRAITDANGNSIYVNNSNGKRVMSAENAYILTNMLQSVVSDGTGRRLGAATEGIPLAGKTGTVGSAESNRDAWMAAYNSEYSAAVWMGYDDSSDGKALPTSVTGGTYPAKFLAAVFNHIYEGKTAPQFVAPNNVKTYRLDKYSLENFHEAVLATPLTPNNSVLNEIFIEGTEPASTSEYWTVPLPPQNVKLTQDSADMLPVIEFTTVSEFAVYQLFRTDYEGNTVMLNQWNGRAGTVKYKDTSARFGSEYSYYILPVHPELTINGSRVSGAKSRVLTIEMPDFMFTSNEQPQTPESSDAPQVP